MKKEPPERRPSAPVLAAVAWVAASSTALLATSSSLFAQMGPPPKPATVIRGGTIHIGNGDILANGIVILRGRRIEAVGVALPVPEGATVIEAAGMHVYPGLIDVESLLLVDPQSRRAGEGNPAAAIADAIDWFDDDARADAWAGGVTTVAVLPRHGLIDGMSAVLKMKPGMRGDDALLKHDGDLAITLALNGDRPSMRLREWKTLAETLQATKKYIESWDDYAEKLEEYKKELEKAKKEGDTKKPDEKKEKKEEGTPPTDPPKEGPGGGPRGEGGPERRRGPRQKSADSPFLRWLRDLTGEVDLGGPEDPDRDEEGDHDHGLLLTDGVSYAEEPAGGQGGAGGQGDKKSEEPKKPDRPGRDAGREALRKALEGKIGVNVYADAAADLQNLLDLLQVYHLKVTISGARDAALVAEQIAAAHVGVVFVQPHDLESETLTTAAKLDAAGIAVVITTAGQTGVATRHLSLSAAAAVAGGMDKEHALAAITSRAAAMLGVADRIGTLEAGKDADVLVTRGELFSSTSAIERLFIDGAAVVAPAAGDHK